MTCKKLLNSLYFVAVHRESFEPYFSFHYL